MAATPATAVSTRSSTWDQARAQKLLNIVLFAAVACSIVHYTDNYLAFDRFPQGGPVRITQDSIWIGWLAFTSFGIAGYVMYRRGRILLASALLAVYAGSGMIGVGHYAVGGTSSFPWWRHAHVSLDIALGFTVFAFAVWSAVTYRRATTGPDRA